MMPPQHRQEAMSMAYIQAVCAKCGWACEIQKQDYGTDVDIKYIKNFNGTRRATGHTLRVQAKSTASPLFENGSLVFDLAVKNYNDLCNIEVGSPIILVVYCMPSDENDWLCIGTNATVLKHCGYWISLRGNTRSENETTQRIRIPSNNVFDETALNDMMERIYRCELL